ncbi:MAG TPA: GNAT family N-acetyltransferase [Candidatus Eisenbacteria bacterium]|jgi:GNAT superfamily N-acetyltransferase
MPQPEAPSPRTRIELSDDHTRIDVPQLMSLYEATWWAQGRTLADVRRALDHSRPIVSAWDGPDLVGFARVISDLTYRATIWDVVVRESHRGRGIGRELMRYVLEHPDLKTVSCFLLLTRDKHSFYERLGFTAEREMTMVLRR